MTLACAQDVSEVLDPLHVPVAQDDKDLFKEKQKYMFAGFDRTLQTDTGKALVREHENCSEDICGTCQVLPQVN